MLRVNRFDIQLLVADWCSGLTVKHGSKKGSGSCPSQAGDRRRGAWESLFAPMLYLCHHCTERNILPLGQLQAALGFRKQAIAKGPGPRLFGAQASQDHCARFKACSHFL